MSQTNNSTAQLRVSLRTRILIGAVIGLCATLFFLIPAHAPSEWGNFWMIRPLIVVPFAGAMGGLCNYIILKYRNLVGLNKALAIILSVIVSIIGLWLGIVLGFNGTMWN